MLFRPLPSGASLRPLEPWQAEEFADHLDRARDHIRPWVGTGFVSVDVAGARETLRRYAELQCRDEGRIAGIWLDDVLVGGVMFVSFDAGSGTCEIGCWLEESAEGRGLMTSACRLALGWAFDVRGMHRVEWRCRSDNLRSAALARRLGMALDGAPPRPERTALSFTSIEGTCRSFRREARRTDHPPPPDRTAHPDSTRPATRGAAGRCCR